MKIFLNKKRLQKFIHKEDNLGFVPTMGALHSGHISLIKKSLNRCNKTIVSIFINKPQFNKNNDFRKYPRVLKNDISKLKKLKIDYLYTPIEKDIYPKGPNTKIKINSFSKKLCGKFRKGHFEAVADVIDRFIRIIRPKKIYFGEKDMQQLKIIENFVKKNYANIDIVGCKTIREKSGIAYSSRNLLLSNREKKIAAKVYKLLFYKKSNLIKKNISIKSLKSKILKIGVKKIDYLEILNINKINKPYKKNRKYRIFIAYYLGSTRLIDNI